jgi:outer membrane protein OmpA-like peptidoglycan-associated protein
MILRVATLPLTLFLSACGGGEPDAAEGPTAGPPTAPTGEAAGPAHPDSSEAERDLLTLAHGATLVSASSAENRALDLLNGNRDDRAWTSERPTDGPPFTFVFELLAPTRLTQVGVDNARDQPSPSDAVARLFEVEASAEGPEAGFVSLGTLTVEEDADAFLDVASGTPVRWLRFTLREGHNTEPAWIYFDEVIAYGEQETVPGDDGRFTGVFETPGRSYVELRQAGAALTGCYTGTSGRGGGTLFGHGEGGVARVRWVDAENPAVNGTALFVIDSAGELVGVQYRLPGRSPWSGPRVEGVTTPCSAVEAPANPVADALETTGEVTLYGIYFDFDQATLKPESEPVLRQLLEALQASPGLAVTIEGHTDDVGSDDYNRDLSQQRAQAVVDWLVEHGLAAERMTPAGRGEAEPVADNATADGRALNRRVEVIRRE